VKFCFQLSILFSWFGLHAWMSISSLSFLMVLLDINYLGMYWTDLHKIFSVGRHMGGDNQSDIRFVIAQPSMVTKFLVNRQKSAHRTFILCTGIPLRIGG